MRNPSRLTYGLVCLAVALSLSLPLRALSSEASAPWLLENHPLTTFPDKDRTAAAERRVVRIGWFSQYGPFHSKDNALWG